LKVPAQAEFVDLIRLNLYGIASKMMFSFEDIEDMKVAVSEACNNAVLHANGGEEGTIEVTFARTVSELTITVRDCGLNFELPTNTAAASHHGKTIDEIKSGGLGIYLMKALMDRVEVNFDGGNAVTLAKKRSRSIERV
jgi:serine/threonine-protein kinase RsbW